MNTNNQGSILIWSLFLMFFVVSAFFYMNMQIKTSLSLTQQNSQASSQLGTSQNIFSDNFYTTLAKDETIILDLTAQKEITLNVGTGGIIYYLDENSSSGMIFSSSGITQSFSGKLSLTGFGGINSIEILGLSESEMPYNYYQKIQTIGGTQIVQQYGKKSHSDID